MDKIKESKDLVTQIQMEMDAQGYISTNDADNLILIVKTLCSEFEAYKETAEEIHQAYTNTHSDSWVLEEALRRITQTLDYAPNVGRYNGSEQRDIALEALQTVWKRREERAKTR